MGHRCYPQLMFPWADVVRLQLCTESIDNQALGIRWHHYKPALLAGGWLQVAVHIGPIVPSIWIRTAWAKTQWQ